MKAQTNICNMSLITFERVFKKQIAELNINNVIPPCNSTKSLIFTQ